MIYYISKTIHFISLYVYSFGKGRSPESLLHILHISLLLDVASCPIASHCCSVCACLCVFGRLLLLGNL